MGQLELSGCASQRNSDASAKLARLEALTFASAHAGALFELREKRGLCTAPATTLWWQRRYFASHGFQASKLEVIFAPQSMDNGDRRASWHLEKSAELEYPSNWCPSLDWTL